VIFFILVCVLLGSTLFHAPPAAAQVRAYQLAATNTMKAGDYLLVDVADASSSTGFRTMRLPYSTLVSLLQSTNGLSVTNSSTTITNNSTNWFFFGTNLLSDEYLSNLFTTNIFLVDSYISNWFQTNIFGTNASGDLYWSNVIGADATLSNWFYNFSQTNEPGSNFFLTNVYTTVEATSNYFTTNYSPTIIQYIDYGSVGRLYVTNVWYLGSNMLLELKVTNWIAAKAYHFMTNAWPGPTNLLDLEWGWQRYVASSDCQITGLTNHNRWANETHNALLTISNAAATNITLRIPADVTTGDGLRAYVISNGLIGKLSLERDPAGPSNAVFRLFY